MAELLLPYNEKFVLVAPTKLGVRSVGLMVNMTDGYRMEPYVIWSPEASPRNKFETMLRFMHDMRKPPWSRVVLIRAKMIDGPFFERLAAYAVLRPLSKIEDWWGSGEDAPFFQTRLIRGDE